MLYNKKNYKENLNSNKEKPENIKNNMASSSNINRHNQKIKINQTINKYQKIKINKVTKIVKINKSNKKNHYIIKKIKI